MVDFSIRVVVVVLSVFGIGLVGARLFGGARVRSDGPEDPMPLSESMAQNDYPSSCELLQTLDLLPEGAIPPMPRQRPRYDDEGPLGVSFYRTLLAKVALDDLTLSRTYFGRSEISDVTFRRTDLAQSTLCWNDFNRVSFESANLSHSDLRACQYVHVSFQNADLSNCDLRRSLFEDCDFRGANLAGAKLTKSGASDLGLAIEQLDSINWQATEGREPGGG